MSSERAPPWLRRVLKHYRGVILQGSGVSGEVGAGDGRLSHFLRVALAKSDAQGADRVTITATDDNSRQLEQFYAVETCDAAEVMNRFQPDVVLVSWMELGQDWTSSFRACESVREYVLVGEVDAGACGHPRPRS